MSLQGPRPPERIPDVLEALRAFWEENPDLRLGQIVGNCANIAHCDPYFLEDGPLLTLLLEAP